MSTTRIVAAGGFRFIPAVYQYSAGVAAEPGFRLERARFARPVPLREGFARIAAHLDALGRPKAAFCACSCAPPHPSPRRGSGLSTPSMAACWKNGASSRTG
ncbi:MAG TPA: hypothetical protein VEY31_02145 [Roseococcus sp.]|nr:hypothetical protein [Roseococcus sp.]